MPRGGERLSRGVVKITITRHALVSRRQEEGTATTPRFLSRLPSTPRVPVRASGAHRSLDVPSGRGKRRWRTVVASFDHLFLDFC